VPAAPAPAASRPAAAGGQCQCDALGNGDRQAHAGERTRAAAERDAIQLAAADAGFGQQRLRPRQAQFGVPARGDLEAFQHLPIDMQGNGTGFGGGFKGEQFHRIRSEQGERGTGRRLRARRNGGRSRIIGHGQPIVA
jgi:hypothetical protein